MNAFRSQCNVCILLVSRWLVRQNEWICREKQPNNSSTIHAICETACGLENACCAELCVGWKKVENFRPEVLSMNGCWPARSRIGRHPHTPLRHARTGPSVQILGPIVDQGGRETGTRMRRAGARYAARPSRRFLPFSVCHSLMLCQDELPKEGSERVSRGYRPQRYAHIIAA